MSTNPIAPMANTPNVPSAANSTKTDTAEFLNLLVAQLQNQNPLDPTDTNEFINQLVSYTGVEQQEAMNAKLDQMVTSFNSLLTANALGYVGHTVEAYGATTSLENGQATWGYSLNANAAEVKITIKDADGNTVWEGKGDTGAGKHTFEWDGKKKDGTQLGDGKYTIEISARDAGGNSVYGYTTIIGQVDGVDSSSGECLLNIGDITVGLNNVIGIRA